MVCATRGSLWKGVPQIGRSTCLWWLLGMAGLLQIGWPQVGWAQASKGRKTGPELEKVSGKIQEIEFKGKAANFIIERTDGGEPLEIFVTPKLKVQITGSADATLLVAKQSVVVRGAFESNKEWFAKRFEVYPGSAPPVSGVQPESDKGGAYVIAGTLLAHENGKLLINAGGKQVPVNFEQGGAPEITVFSSQLELAKVGSPIEVEGSTRGGKFLPQKLSIQLQDPLTPEDFAPRKPEKKASPPKAKKDKGSKPAKSAEEPEPPAGEFDPDDPFGDKKKAKSSATPPPAADPASRADQG